MSGDGIIGVNRITNPSEGFPRPRNPARSAEIFMILSHPTIPRALVDQPNISFSLGSSSLLTGVPPEFKESYILSLIDGLKHLHYRFVTLVDINPSTISCNENMAYFTDASSAVYTGFSMVGDPNAFHAPETHLSHRCDFRSDVFSLGMWWYVCSTKRTSLHQPVEEFQHEAFKSSVGIMRLMLEPKPHHRPTIFTVASLLSIPDVAQESPLQLAVDEAYAGNMKDLIRYIDSTPEEGKSAIYTFHLMPIMYKTADDVGEFSKNTKYLNKYSDECCGLITLIYGAYNEFKDQFFVYLPCTMPPHMKSVFLVAVFTGNAQLQEITLSLLEHFANHGKLELDTKFMLELVYNGVCPKRLTEMAGHRSTKEVRDAIDVAIRNRHDMAENIKKLLRC